MHAFAHYPASHGGASATLDPERRTRLTPPFLALLLVLGIWIASDLVPPTILAAWSGRLRGFVTVFLGIFIEALPFLLAGVLVSSAIHLYVSAAQVQRWSPRNPLLAAIAGSILGLAFPVCECGSIPTARRLIAKGAALPAGIAFVLAAPVINPVVLAATFVAFGSWAAGHDSQSASVAPLYTRRGSPPVTSTTQTSLLPSGRARRKARCRPSGDQCGTRSWPSLLSWR